MALPAESSGRNRPATCWTRIKPEFIPAILLTLASSAVETVRSAVTTTRREAAFTYHAMPSTPDRETARLTSDKGFAPRRWGALDATFVAGAAGASDEKARAEVATRPTVAATRPVARAICRRGCVRSAVMSPHEIDVTSVR